MWTVTQNCHLKSHLILGTCIFHLISTTGFIIYRKWNLILQTRRSKYQSKKLRQIGSKQKNRKTNIKLWRESGRKVQLMFWGSFILRWMSESGGIEDIAYSLNSKGTFCVPLGMVPDHITRRIVYIIIGLSSLSASAECGFILNSNYVSLYHILLQSVKVIAADTFVHFVKNYKTKIEWFSYWNLLFFQKGKAEKNCWRQRRWGKLCHLPDGTVVLYLVL